MHYYIRRLKISGIGIAIVMLLISMVLCGCEQAAPVETSIEPANSSDGSNILTTKDFIDIGLSDPEGSGAIRTLTLHYLANGKQESAQLDEITRVDCKSYDDESKEQILTESDFNQDGIIEIIVYQEFEFPDIDLAHVEVPLWPTVYEYDLNKGFVVASAKYKDYFKAYAEKTKEELEAAKDMSDSEKLALGRLIYAAEKIADGSFNPNMPYSHDYHNNNNAYYTDVYELVKNMDANEITSHLSESVQPSGVSGGDEDSEIVEKLLHLCAFSDNKAPLKEEFLALIKGVKKEGEKYILTIDRIEETNNGDIQDDYYTNKEVKNEEYVIDLNKSNMS